MIKTRFAPSPTGYLHIGNARVAILNYLYSKKKELNFFLRIDDTDAERSKQEFIDSILDTLFGVELEHDQIGPDVIDQVRHESRRHHRSR